MSDEGVLDKLIPILTKIDGCAWGSFTEDIHRPQWKTHTSPSDWQSYVPVGMKRLWQKMPFEARLMAVFFARQHAKSARDMEISRSIWD